MSTYFLRSEFQVGDSTVRADVCIYGKSRNFRRRIRQYNNGAAIVRKFALIGGVWDTAISRVIRKDSRFAHRRVRSGKVRESFYCGLATENILAEKLPGSVDPVGDVLAILEAPRRLFEHTGA